MSLIKNNALDKLALKQSFLVLCNGHAQSTVEITTKLDTLALEDYKTFFNNVCKFIGGNNLLDCFGSVCWVIYKDKSDQDINKFVQNINNQEIWPDLFLLLKRYQLC